MATRWKNISYSGWVKLAVVVIALAGTLMINSALPYFQVLDFALLPAEYDESNKLDQALSSWQYSLYRLVNYYISEEHIEAGKSTEVDYEDYKRQERRRYNDAVAGINQQYNQWIDDARQAGDEQELARLQAEREQDLANEAADLERSLANFKEVLIHTHLQNYRAALEHLASPGVYYHYQPTSGAAPFTNLADGSMAREFFSSLPASLENDAREGIYYVGLAPDKYKSMADEYALKRNQGLAALRQVCLGLLLFFAGLVFLMVTAGRRVNSKEIALLWWDHIYLDLWTFALAASLLISVGVSQYKENILPLDPWLGISFTLALGGTALLYITTVSKRIKRRELLKHTLIYSISAWLLGLMQKPWQAAKELLGSGPVALRTGALWAAYAASASLTLAATLDPWGRGGPRLLAGLTFIALNGLALLLVLKRARELEQISSGARRIGSGDLAYRIQTGGSVAIRVLADQINNIAGGLELAISNEVRSERMKAELITNVSHDLKTPLTSLITYVDLLKKEGLDSENALKYLDVLDRKSQRLQALTEDLFEAAKAASGNIAMKIERIDMGALLTQGLGEMSEKLEASDLDWRISLPTEKLYVDADGRLLWRVMENLVSNILKYALAGSRVYVEAGQEGETTCLTFKNISAEALNIDAADLLERFTRGDAARQGEGSGLGLSIAKSLVELQGGGFDITIDGDLFKASVCLPRVDN